MRFILNAATAAAITLFATAATGTTASADGWADSTAYRSLGWGAASQGRGHRATRSNLGAPPRIASSQRRGRVSRDRDDDERPQRRSRSARSKSHTHQASIGSGSGGGSVGVASYYWQPQRVASGGWFNPSAMTAAHKTLPFGTRVRVTHLGNGRSVTVTINDRGPYIAGRIIDLSRAAASAISMTGQGVARIRMTVLGR
ncbi:MAG: septal ring lytic transglycosylase RlpA family protein [Hyphomicrobiaceae bacterium]